MADLFTYHNEIVSLNPGTKSIKSIKELIKLTSRQPASVTDIIRYLYFMYDKSSPYADMLPSDRHELVCDEQCDWKLIESVPRKLIEEAGEIIQELQSTPSGKFLVGVIAKIDEYLLFWKNTKIDEKNHDLIASTLKNAKDLLTLKQGLEKMVNDEASIRNVGDRKAKLFEDIK